MVRCSGSITQYPSINQNHLLKKRRRRRRRKEKRKKITLIKVTRDKTILGTTRRGGNQNAYPSHILHQIPRMHSFIISLLSFSFSCFSPLSPSPPCSSPSLFTPIREEKIMILLNWGMLDHGIEDLHIFIKSIKT